jgi:hypothetical protein
MQVRKHVVVRPAHAILRRMLSWTRGIVLFGVLTVACGGRAISEQGYGDSDEDHDDVSGLPRSPSGKGGSPTAGTGGRASNRGGTSSRGGSGSGIAGDSSVPLPDCWHWGSRTDGLCQTGTDCQDGSRYFAECRNIDGEARCLCWEGGATTRPVIKVSATSGNACDIAYVQCAFPR